MRQAREGVVEADHDHPAWACQRREVGERRARIGRVVQDARASRPRRTMPRAAPGRRRSVSTNSAPSTPKRRAASAPSSSEARVRSAPTTTAPAAGQKEAHLAGAAAELEHPGVLRDRLVEQPRELAPPGARAQALQGIALADNRGTATRCRIAVPSRCADRARGIRGFRRSRSMNGASAPRTLNAQAGRIKPGRATRNTSRTGQHSTLPGQHQPVRTGRHQRTSQRLPTDGPQPARQQR